LAERLLLADEPDTINRLGKNGKRNTGITHGDSFQKADRTNAQQIHEMQVAAFLPLYEKYRDEETSPVTAGIEKSAKNFSKRFGYAVLEDDGRDIGAIRIKKITVLPADLRVFHLPEFQNRGIAQQVIAQIEADYPMPQCGSWTPFCRKHATVICMRKSGTEDGRIQNHQRTI
jgi:GNAT superfamily N-acetyltransferase